MKMNYIWYILLSVLIIICLGVGIIYFLRRRHNFLRCLNFTFLLVKIQKKESKEDMERDRDQISEIRRVIGSGEHFFQSLYGIFSSDWNSLWQGQSYLSFEYIATDKEIKFYVGCPSELKDLIEKQITSFYPEAVIEETETPECFKDNTHQATGYLSGNKHFYYPLKTYMKFESADPMSNILNTLSNAANKAGDSAAVQIMIRPVKNNWQIKARKLAKKLASGSSSFAWYNPFVLLGKIFEFLISGSDDDVKSDDQTEKDTESQETVKAIEEKADRSGFETIIRLVTSSSQSRIAKVHLSSILNAFAQYSLPSINGLGRHKWHSSRSLIKNFIFRAFKRSWHVQNKLILTPDELASLFHFPHIKYNNIPAIKWQKYKVVKAPSNVPTEGLLLGYNNYRGEKTPIYMNKEDRFRHFYVIGQTGTGKSSIFQTMIRQDLMNNEGLCVIDPHGSLVESLLPYVPKHRVDDVIIFDPSDLERPMGLNLLEADTEEEKDMVALDAMNIMIKMFDEEIFGPRLQDYFRNGVLTLMSDPNGGAITDVLRLFTDDVFQQSKVKHVTNPVVKSFWTKQMAQTGQREKQEIIPYFAAKFGAFVTNSMLRNIIGQTHSAFDFAKVMDEGKVLFMNLSKGMTGDINSKLLGLIIVSKLQVAALRRQKKLGEGVKPRDFFMYIDEFQNYVTDSIESILSEARKYRLSLNIAHQYINQIDTSNQNKKGVNLKDAVFGNVGTMMSYKIGSQDAEMMTKEMAPSFTDQDLINIDAFKAVIKLAINGQPSTPFSLDVEKPWLVKGNPKMAAALKQISRLTYGRSKKYVEKMIFARLNV